MFLRNQGHAALGAPALSFKEDLIKTYYSLFVALLALAGQVAACDLCGCYTPRLETVPSLEGMTAGPSWLTGVYGAVSEQFTHFGTVQVDGDEVGNPANQYLDSSITQLVGGYNFGRRFALQVNVPLIYRSFSRPEGFTIDRGTESGLGDVSLSRSVCAFPNNLRLAGAR